MTNKLEQKESPAAPSSPNTQEVTWAYKYSLISPWFEHILSQIKKDCKTEHLSIDPHFVRTYFAGKPVARISLEEMRAVYLQQIFAGHDRLAEFIANRWLFRNMEIYRFFEKELESKIPHFDHVTELPQEAVEPILHEAIQKYGIEPVFCFTVLNDVALPKALFEKLQKDALQLAAESQDKNEKLDAEEKQIQALKAEIISLKERQERKLAEVQKKHRQEIERLMKDIQTLHNQLETLKARV